MPNMMVVSSLPNLEEIKTDYITVGDTGVFYVVNRDSYSFKTIYDASTMVTSSHQN